MFRGAPSAVNLESGFRLTKARLAAAAQWWLAPARCVLCAGAGADPRLDLCAHCLALLPGQQPLWRMDESGFDLLLHPWHYAYPVDAMLRGLKFGGELAYGRVLGTLLGRQRRLLGAPWPSIVVPLPLHPRRYAARGFNQAAELAKAAARELDAAVDSHSLIRIRNTRAQSGLNSASRRNNMRQALHCRLSSFSGPVALVDDVMTTGATARAAAGALRAAGVTWLELWVVARVANLQML